jgi:hypothetical protein
MRATRVMRWAALGVLVGGMATVGAAPAAFAGQNQHFNSFVFPLGGGGSGPPPGCPVQTGPNAIASASGNGVMHDSTNKNGDWGGVTYEGSAVFESVPGGFDTNGNPIGPVTPLYEGHLTFWGGNGNNKAGQSTGGVTLTYQGTAITGASAPSATIHIHFNGQTTTNNSGTTTANFMNASCTA